MNRLFDHNLLLSYSMVLDSIEIEHGPCGLSSLKYDLSILQTMSYWNVTPVVVEVF